MSDAAIFIGWGEVIPGREKLAVQVFDEVVQYYAGLLSTGEISGFDPFLLEPHGGDLSGFLLIRGDAEKLGRIRMSEKFISMNARGQMVVQNFGVVGAVTGAELGRQFGDFQAQAEDLLGGA